MLAGAFTFDTISVAVVVVVAIQFTCILLLNIVLCFANVTMKATQFIMN